METDHSQVTSPIPTISKVRESLTKKSLSELTNQNGHVLLSIKYNSKTEKFTSIWKKKLFILDLEESEFEKYLCEIIVFLQQENIIQSRTFRLQNYEDCFVASEIIDVL
eukprot:gene4991-8589_t